MEKKKMIMAEMFTYVSHVLALVAAGLVLVWCIHFRGGLAFRSTDKSHIFNVHPVLMLIGFIIMGGEGIMSYKTLPWSRDAKKLTHLILHAIALVLGCVGIYAAFKYHKESGIDNFYTLHSWVGLSTISLYGFQWIIGFITFFYPGGRISMRRSLIPWHAIFGLFLFILAVGNAELGFLEKLTFLQISGLVQRHGSESLLVNFTALVVILLGASIVISTMTPTRLEETTNKLDDI